MGSVGSSDAKAGVHHHGGRGPVARDDVMFGYVAEPLLRLEVNGQEQSVDQFNL